MSSKKTTTSRFPLFLLLLSGVTLLGGCGGTGLANVPASDSASTIAVPAPVDTIIPPTWDPRTPYPPTTTPVYPPDYKTPTPIPPEHRMFFIWMGNGGAGEPAVQPRASKAPAITKEDVEGYASTHPMRGGHVSINTEPGARITGVELTTLAGVYERYGLQPGQAAPFPLDTSVYLVEVEGVFHIVGGLYPGDRGTYHTGIRVFNTLTGDTLREGGVGAILTPTPGPTRLHPQ